MKVLIRFLQDPMPPGIMFDADEAMFERSLKIMAGLETYEDAEGKPITPHDQCMWVVYDNARDPTQYNADRETRVRVNIAACALVAMALKRAQRTSLYGAVIMCSPEKGIELLTIPHEGDEPFPLERFYPVDGSHRKRWTH